MSFRKLLSVSFAVLFKHSCQYPASSINHINFIFLSPQEVIFHTEYQCVGKVKTLRLLSPF